MSRPAWLLILTAALSSGAFAQSTNRVETPLHVELGVYVPTIGGGVVTSAGGSFGLEYAFAREKSIQFGAAARCNFFHASSHGVGGDITLSSGFLTASYHPVRSKLFGGVGLGAAQADIRTGGINFTTDTDLVYSIDAGVDIGPRTYLLGRYQGSSQQGQRGLTLGVGYRF